MAVDQFLMIPPKLIKTGGSSGLGCQLCFQRPPKRIQPSMGLGQAIKDGPWFAQFMKSCLSSYDRRVMAQVRYTVRLQVRLTYDLHLVYGIPLDANDPGELIQLLSVVYGIKAAEVGGLGIKAYGPEMLRAQL